MRNVLRLAVPTVIVACTAVALAAPASAHERRKVAGYDFTVGFGTEPAYAGQPNRVQLILAKDGKPVEDIGQDLKVAVSFGDKTVPLELEPKFKVGAYGEVGDFGAEFVPTRSGAYTFHFTGTLGGQPVDEKFTGSPTTFSEVASPAEKAFPVADPLPADLAARLQTTTQQLDDAKSAATMARWMALGGLLLAVVALGAALSAGRARRAAVVEDATPARV